MNSYLAYGLTIHSFLHLPELPVGGEKADVVFVLDKVEHPNPIEPYPFVRQASGDIFLAIYRVGRFLIQDGRKVIIDPFAQTDERVLRIFLLGMVMGVLLHQRGKSVFHASAVTVSGEAVAFMGAKCAGKSSTAANFHAAGCDLITDDILALSQKNGAFLVSPGVPQLKLMPDAALYLHHIPETHETIHPVLEKHPLRISQGFARLPLPLTRVYLLYPAENNEIVRLGRKQAVKELLPHWYGAQFGMGMIQALGAPAFLRHCAGLAEHVPICLLRRRQDLAVFPEIVELVERDLARSQ